MAETVFAEKIVGHNGNNRVSVRHIEYLGKQFIDIRQQFSPDDGDTWLFTKKGVRLSLDDASSIADVIYSRTEVER